MTTLMQNVSVQIEKNGVSGWGGDPHFVSNADILIDNDGYQYWVNNDWIINIFGGSTETEWGPQPEKTPAPNEREVEVPQKETLPPDFGTRPGENIEAKFAELSADMVAWLEEYAGVTKATIVYSNGDTTFKFRQDIDDALENFFKSPDGTEIDFASGSSIFPLNIKDMGYYSDLASTIGEDLQEMKEGWNDGTLQDQIELYNRLSYEFNLEVKYNVNLTGNGAEWSQADLEDLDAQLGLLPPELTTLDSNLDKIIMQSQNSGVAGVNYNNGILSVGPGQVEWAMIHEIGHNFDSENPKWEEFQALSGWTDVTSQFENIGSDYIDTDGDGIDDYEPYLGTATLKRDGNVYHDKDQIDLDGDGKIDGIVQVQKGKVMVYDLTATFIADSTDPKITDYSTVNPYEDFAETFKYFFTNPDELKKVSPEKYQFMLDFVESVKTSENPFDGMLEKIKSWLK